MSKNLKELAEKMGLNLDYSYHEFSPKISLDLTARNSHPSCIRGGIIQFLVCFGQNSINNLIEVSEKRVASRIQETLDYSCSRKDDVKVSEISSGILHIEYPYKGEKEERCKIAHRNELIYDGAFECYHYRYIRSQMKMLFEKREFDESKEELFRLTERLERLNKIEKMVELKQYLRDVGNPNFILPAELEAKLMNPADDAELTSMNDLIGKLNAQIESQKSQKNIWLNRSKIVSEERHQFLLEECESLKSSLRDVEQLNEILKGRVGDLEILNSYQIVNDANLVEGVNREFKSDLLLRESSSSSKKMKS